MTYRFALPRDCALLGELNHQLIQDEGHRNPMSPEELEARMRGWLATEYKGVIFEKENELVGYALYREEVDQIYLRQFFILRHLRRKGYGRAAMKLLIQRVWPKDKRLTVDVLVTNSGAVNFWRSVGYKEYSLLLEIMPGVRASSK